MTARRYTRKQVEALNRIMPGIDDRYRIVMVGEGRHAVTLSTLAAVLAAAPPDPETGDVEVDFDRLLGISLTEGTAGAENLGVDRQATDATPSRLVAASAYLTGTTPTPRMVSDPPIPVGPSKLNRKQKRKAEKAARRRSR